jgi:large subunit ribosomal protein L14e
LTNGNLRVGQLVLSTAGRDKDSLYIIYAIVNDNFLLVIDGKNRKITKPKKKNSKHLRLLLEHAGEIADKLKQGENFTDVELRKSLKSLGVKVRNVRNT